MLSEKNKFHAQKRRALMKAMHGEIMLIQTSKPALRNGDVHHTFRQDSHFLYLTGIESANHALLLNTRTGEETLYIPDANKLFLIWEGKQKNLREMKEITGIKNVRYLSQLEKDLKKISKKIHRIDGKLLCESLAELRVRKDDYEIKLMRKANSITALAHQAVFKITRPGLREYQVQATFEKVCKEQGAIHLAYPSIVATGPNAAILHYRDNNCILKKSHLLLIDAACEWHGYAADVTRTFPVNGKFTSEQSDLYAVVLRAQKESIRKVRSGITMLEIHNHCSKLLIDGLKEIGIFKNVATDTLFETQAHRLFFPHSTGHLLGLDVHDVGSISPQDHKKIKKLSYLRLRRKLEENFVITVEPGIYFIDALLHDEKVRKKHLHHINWKKVSLFKKCGGIRIEDDIVVKKSGYENLTSVPKEQSDIEKIMSESIA